jgi:hypothetical protein
MEKKMGLDMYLSAERPVANLPSLVKAKLADALYDTDDLNPEDRELYISGWDHSDAEEKEAFHSAVLAAGLEEFVTPASPSAYIIPGDPCTVRITVAYWRKANAIHKWFVDNCMNGVDECVWSEPIPRSKLRELKQLCERVINQTEMVKGDVCNGYTFDSDGMKPILEPGELMANTKQAEKLLPTQSGFFFGSTDYDEYYIQALKHTVEQLTEALRCPQDTVFRYRPSW